MAGEKSVTVRSAPCHWATGTSVPGGTRTRISDLVREVTVTCATGHDGGLLRA